MDSWTVQDNFRGRMVTNDEFRAFALSFPGTSEQPHFEKASFRTSKIFATLSEKDNRANLLLTPTDQSVFCSYDKEVIYPVPNKWGLQGWTIFELKKIRKTMLKDALSLAFSASLAKKK